MNRQALYAAANLCFFALVVVGYSIASAADAVHPVYLVLLFALCSSPILSLRALNDRYVLLSLFGFFYFVYYGVIDIATLLLSSTPVNESPGGVFTEAEMLILAGGVAAFGSYHLAVAALRPSAAAEARVRDWSLAGLLLGGGTLWAVSTWLTWKLKVELLVDTMLETMSRAYAAVTPLQLNILQLANYMQPLGVVILAYAYARYRKVYILVPLACVIAVEMVMGFVADSKGQVLIGTVLAAFTLTMASGKLPKSWLVAVGAMVVLVFPILQANRIAMQIYGTGHEAAAQNVMETLERALETKESVDSGHYRAESFFERTSLKANVTMIVTKTGHEVEYQNGRTIVSLLAAFIPRMIWPDKPDTATGRLVNTEFTRSEQRQTNISPSHLGELYWNFGWPGALIGMVVIGGLLGTIAVRFDLTRAINLTRILVMIVTIKMLIIGFEGVINVNYSMWMRTMAAVGIMHLIFARRRTDTAPSQSDSRQPASQAVPTPTPALTLPAPLRPPSAARFPNLMS
jgi:hypothetical protein